KAALNGNPVKTKGWPEQWKPYVIAWKQAKGRIEDKKDFSVRDTVRFLKKDTFSDIKNWSQLIDDSMRNTWQWMNTRKVSNIKKDIYWHLQRRALPLEHRIRHINCNDTGNCSNCLEVIQTPEHFALDCPTSKKIWKIVIELADPTTSIKMPNNFNAMFADHYTGNKQLRNWINITTIHEIWYRYTQLKWGAPIPNPILESVIKYRVKKAIEIMKYIGGESSQNG
ncbi:3070_t:CDS:2, partial [Scutellospora calospora]